MENLGKRLYELRKNKKLSREALGARIGVSKTSIKNWEDGENVPKLEYLQLLSDYFKCSVEYLTKGVSDGDGHDLHNARKVVDKPIRYAPVLNFVQAGNFCQYHDDAITNEFEPIVGEGYGDNSFWVILHGESMVPDFFSKELVLINPDLQPNPGDFVLAIRKNEKETTFKKWRPRGFDEKTGEEYYELVPSNIDFPVIDSRFTPFTVCGVAVERRQKLR